MKLIAREPAIFIGYSLTASCAMFPEPEQTLELLHHIINVSTPNQNIATEISKNYQNSDVKLGKARNNH